MSNTRSTKKSKGKPVFIDPDDVEVDYVCDDAGHVRVLFVATTAKGEKYVINMDENDAVIAGGDLMNMTDERFRDGYSAGYERAAYELDPNWSSRADGVPNGPASAEAAA
jgi:hypothetical protein